MNLEPVRLLSIIPANASGRCCGLRDLADDWGISEQDMFFMLKALSDAGFIETDQPEFCEDSSICFRSLRGDELVHSHYKGSLGSSISSPADDAPMSGTSIALMVTTKMV